MSHAHNFIDLTGKSFGRLTVISRAENSPSNQTRWLCRCECGTELPVIASSLRDGLTTSCGCRRAELNRARNVKHGYARSGRKRTGIYHVWAGMIQRCNNPKTLGYDYYGGRGIRVCKRWLKFENFLADMGERPPGLTIERRNNNGNYCPSNCYWGTREIQCNNRRNSVFLTFNGITLTMAQWSRKLNIKYLIIISRLRRGWSVRDTLITPMYGLRKNNPKINSEVHPMAQ